MQISPVSYNSNLYQSNSNISSNPINSELPSGAVNFGSQQKKDKNNHTALWVIGGLAVAGILGYIFRKDVSKALGLKHTWSDVTKNIINNPDKKDVFKFSELKEHMKNIHLKDKELDYSVAMKLPDNMKKEYNITSPEAILIAYKVKNKNDYVFTKLVTCNKLDDEFIKTLNGKDSLHLNHVEKG